MQPFSNIRVIDLTHVIAGPFCTYQLAVLGADVIKIEPPATPDMVRARKAGFPNGEDGLGAVYTSQGANKRAISIDLEHSSGKEILSRLVEDADVLVENYRAGALAGLGFGYETVKSIRPDIIYCSLTGFGQTGPDGSRTAYDNVIQAASGLMASNGTAETSPIKVGPPVLDYGTGAQAAFAIAAALFQRTTTGKGQYIDIAMQDAALILMSSHVNHILKHGESPRLSGNSNPHSAGYGCYETKDGLLMIGAYNGSQASRLWDVLGDSGHGKELASLQPPGFEAHFDRDHERIAEILKTREASSWELALRENGVPAARVRTLEQALKDTQLGSRNAIQTLETNNGENRLPGCSISNGSRRPCPQVSTARFRPAHARGSA